MLRTSSEHSWSAAVSIRVVCRCGKAFQAPPQLAGKTVGCPACKLPMTIPDPATLAAPALAPLGASDPFGAGSPLGPLAPADPFGVGQNPLGSAAGGLTAASPTALGTYADPFAAQLASPAQHAAQTPQPAKRNQLLLWLAIGGGGWALIVVIGVIIAVGLNRGTRPVASSTSVPLPSSTPPTPLSPSTTPPVPTPPGSTPSTPTAAGVKTLPTEDEAKQFAQRLEQAVAGGDGEAITKAVDWDQLLSSAVSGIDAPRNFAKASCGGRDKRRLPRSPRASHRPCKRARGCTFCACARHRGNRAPCSGFCLAMEV